MLRIIIILAYTGNNNASHILIIGLTASNLAERAKRIIWTSGLWSTLRHPNPGKTYYVLSMTDSTRMRVTSKFYISNI